MDQDILPTLPPACKRFVEYLEECLTYKYSKIVPYYMFYNGNLNARNHLGEYVICLKLYGKGDAEILGYVNPTTGDIYNGKSNSYMGSYIGSVNSEHGGRECIDDNGRIVDSWFVAEINRFKLSSIKSAEKRYNVLRF